MKACEVDEIELIVRLKDGRAKAIKMTMEQSEPVNTEARLTDWVSFACDELSKELEKP